MLNISRIYPCRSVQIPLPPLPPFLEESQDFHKSRVHKVNNDYIIGISQTACVDYLSS